MQRLDITTIEADFCKPLPVHGPFDSAALGGVLHCPPGRFASATGWSCVRGPPWRWTRRFSRPTAWSSRAGSLAVAGVIADGDVAFTVASVYAAWLGGRGRGHADGMAHRILSDLSLLLGDRRPPHRLIVAGDWNVLRGCGEGDDEHWRARYEKVFQRAEALGLRFVGPEYPNGRQADPWPEELPHDSLCVPTFHHNRQTPSAAARQLGFVFASKSIADRIEARALNGPAGRARAITVES